MRIKLPSIINSGMVLERKARIWGTCDDDAVNVSFRGRRYAAAATDGKWEVELEDGETGGPFELVIGDIVLTDVYVGYVFIGCGQSNIETPVSRVRIKYDDDFRSVDNPRVRAFQVERDYAFDRPRDDCAGMWRAAAEETINDFFAVPYYFARMMEKALDAPIGVIACAAGGSRIESWLAEDSVRDVGYVQELLRLCKLDGFADSVTQNDLKRAELWREELWAGDIGFREGFHAVGYDHGGWPTRPLTSHWTGDIGLLNGSVWFRRTFDLDKSAVGLPALLFLGRITDSDRTYVNGELVGETEYQYPPRVYPVREGLLREGANSLAVRVVSERGYGGFTAGKDYMLEIGDRIISLDGDWAYQIGRQAPPLPLPTSFPAYPCGLYNAMLHPVLPYSISAFLWYQGESNDRSPYGYNRLLARFIRDIRAICGKSLPFLAVQLPNYDAGELNDAWRLIREQQATVLDYSDTALIITTDIGEDNDLHPLNKRDVAGRLAIGALHLLRGDPITTDKVYASANSRLPPIRK